MTDLTDKWKKGELPDAYYYCKTGNGVEILRTWGDKYNQLLNNLDEVFMKEMSDCKIISEVPCYDEWFKIKNLASLTSLLQEKNIECLHRENKLKELLKDCRYIMGIEKDFASCHVEKDKLCKLLAKINRVLGEDK